MLIRNFTATAGFHPHHTYNLPVYPRQEGNTRQITQKLMEHLFDYFALFFAMTSKDGNVVRVFEHCLTENS